MPIGRPAGVVGGQESLEVIVLSHLGHLGSSVSVWSLKPMWVRPLGRRVRSQQKAVR